MADLARTGVGGFLSRITGSGTSLSSVKGHVTETGHALAQVGESALVGAILGAASVELKDGLDFHKVPLDLAVGAAGIVGGLAMANEPVARDLRNGGSAGIAIFIFRKTQDFLAAKKSGVKRSSAKVHGDFGDDIGAEADPVLAAAAKL